MLHAYPYSHSTKENMFVYALVQVYMQGLSAYRYIILYKEKEKFEHFVLILHFKNIFYI